MYTAAAKTPSCLDNATYIGPLVIKQTENHGKGVFATKNIAAGDLLLCEKAFASCPTRDERYMSASPDYPPEILQHIYDRRVVVVGQAELNSVLGKKLSLNPSLVASVTSLAHGQYEPAQNDMVDGMPIIDS